MGLILVVLLLALIFGGLGFVYPVLWMLRWSFLSSGPSDSVTAVGTPGRFSKGQGS